MKRFNRSRNWPSIRWAVGLVLAASLNALSAVGPCDIYLAGGTPCIAAHSTVRALYGAYTGPLYQVQRTSDKQFKDINAISAGGAADGASQDSFCVNTTCNVIKVYDQSGTGNTLESQTSTASFVAADNPTVATTESFNLSGHKVYSLYIKPGNSFWHDGHTTKVPLGAAAEGVYMVTSGTHYNSGCCYDYGNSETDRKPDGDGAMDAIYFGSSCWFNSANYNCTVSGTGPWVQADLEYGIFAWNTASTWNNKEVTFNNPYVTAMLKNNGTTLFSLKGANAQSGSLTTLWSGTLPPGYNPMKKQGAIILGSGGDCCSNNMNQSQGTFYEGALVAGYPTDATDTAVQANIVQAGYGNNNAVSINPGMIYPSSLQGGRPAYLNLFDLNGKLISKGILSDDGKSIQTLGRVSTGAYILKRSKDSGPTH